MSFNCYSERILRESADLSEIGIKISGRIINNLRYADDIILIAKSPNDLQQLLDKVDEVSRKFGLEISTRKTKVMVVAKERIMMHIYCNGELLEQVNSFRYLGSIITESGDCSKDIKMRLGIGRSAIKSLECIWKDRSLSITAKKRVLQTVIWPVALHGAEAWTFKKADMKRITAFEMTCYRRMLRINWRQHRTNTSILEELEEQNRLLAMVKCRKLRYFGHIVRARNLCTSILHGRIDGTRGRGRPRRRWTDDIREWSRMSIVECIQTAEDRGRWRAVVSSSMASDLQQ